MKYIVGIQVEFLKKMAETADEKRYDWDVWSREEQLKYLRKHPKSRKKLTAVPSESKARSRKMHGLVVKAMYKELAPRFEGTGYKLPDELKLDLLPDESPLLGWGSKKGIWVSPIYFKGSNRKALKRLMLHEMCHAAIERKYKFRPAMKPTDHGHEYRMLAKMVGADPSAHGSEEDRWIGVPKKDRHE